MPSSNHATSSPRERSIALLVSVAVHVFIVAALWGGGAPAEPADEARRPPPELVFRQLEARRVASAPVAPQPARASEPRRHGRGALAHSPAPARAVATTLPLATSEEAPAEPSAPKTSRTSSSGGDGAAHPSDPEGGDAAHSGPGGAGDGAALPAGGAAPAVELAARVRSLPIVSYPARALEEELEGVVRLWVEVDAEGTVTSVRVLSDPGLGLGLAAREAMLSARFVPASRDGTPHPSAFEYAYRFRLE